jgi:uncharacterized protein
LEPNLESDVEALVLWIMRSLVDYPDEIQIEPIRTGTETKFHVTVAQPDMRRVIGKDGQTVNAIRTVLSGIAAAARMQGRVEVRYKLEIVTKD